MSANMKRREFITLLGGAATGNHLSEVGAAVHTRRERVDQETASALRTGKERPGVDPSSG
jgi:hypothetical protein